MKKVYLTENSRETQKLGSFFARKLLDNKAKKTACVLGLDGELGSGKTKFLQGFARGLGVKEKITSPTFVVMKRLGIPGPRFKNFYHFDCYRVEGEKEILDLGWAKIISNPLNVVAVEWADKIKEALPKSAIMVKFETTGENRRRIKIDP